MSTYHPSTVDYNKRTVDLLLLKTVYKPTSESVVTPDASVSPMMVTGIEKLVQRFAYLFLTQVGTVHNVDREGTNFMSNLGAGRIYDDSTLMSSAVEANRITQTLIKTEDLELDTPDDEALDSSEVIDTKIDRGAATVSVTISITTVSGDTYTYITPINIGV